MFRLKELAEVLCKEAKTRSLDYQDTQDKIRAKLEVKSVPDYVGPNYRRMEENLFSILYEWRRNNPTATIPQLARHLLALGFSNVAFKLDPML